MLLLAAGLLGPAPARAGGEAVAVVYNSALPESEAVAEYYAKARQIPKGQLFGFALPTGLEISRADFRDHLQAPLADQLASRKLWTFGDVMVPASKNQPRHTVPGVVATKIRYLVLCYGVPVRIIQDDSIHEDGETNFPPEFRPNTASVDSELVWLPLVNLHPHLNGPMQNWVFATTNEMTLSPTNGVLLVARLDGPSPDIARGLVDKALAAERDGWWGRAYFDARGLPPTDRYYHGDELILGAADLCGQLGFETIVDTNSATFPVAYPLSQVAVYCGWYDADVSGPFTRPQVEFMPGAFAYHLHSFSAADLRSSTNNWVGPLLAKGATCTMGCVSEPYLAFTPNLIVFFEALSRGWTFGEAAWAAQPGLSWQTTVVGDPLYRPFSKSPAQLQADLLKRKSPLLEWSVLRLVNLDRKHGAPLGALAASLEQLSVTSRSAVLTEKLADLTEALGKPASAIDYYQRALTLNPSAQQRVRLRLTLGTELTAEHRPAEAAEDYRQLLREVPDYPAKDDLTKTLEQLEPKPAKP